MNRRPSGGAERAPRSAPEQRGTSPHHEGDAGGECLNCGARSGGRYCGDCGQRRGGLDDSVWSIVKQFAQEVTSLEGRLLRTVRPLALRPGTLTAEYLAGRRRAFTPPLRLYLGASFLFFGVFLLTRPVDQAYYGLSGDHESTGYTNAVARLLIGTLPVMAVLLKLIYLRTGRPLVHHLVFSLHVGAATLLWYTLLTLTAITFKAVWGHHGAAPRWVPDFFYWLYLPGIAALLLYLVAALRRTYRRGWVVSAAAAAALVAMLGWLFVAVGPALLGFLGGP